MSTIKQGGSNIYSDALYIFSSRLLRPEYVGPCCRVLRASDNDELDINFVDGLRSDSAISDFCGTSVGHIGYYNQGTEAGDDAGISSLSTNLPVVWDGSAFYNFNGKQCHYFNANPLSFRHTSVGNFDHILDLPSMALTLGNIRYASGQLRGILGERKGNFNAIAIWADSRTNKFSARYAPDGTIRDIVYNSILALNQELSFGYSKSDDGVINNYLDGAKQTNELTGMSEVRYTLDTSSNIRWGGSSTTSSSNSFIGESPELVIFDYYDATRLAAVIEDQKTYYGIS